MFRIECSCCSDILGSYPTYGQAIDITRSWTTYISQHTSQGTRTYYSSGQPGSIDVLVYRTF